jgi:hypothetical protein
MDEAETKHPHCIRWKQAPPVWIVTTLFACLLSACSRKEIPPYQPPPGVSWSSVLREASDIGSLAAPVQSWERSSHFSSSSTTGKVTLANLAPEVLGDMDHGFFLKVEENADEVDATLAEMEGAGMITWIWSANPVGTIRLFIDDEKIPILEMPFADFIRGTFLPVAYPYASITANGYNLHFPIIHQKYCRLVVRVPQKADLATLFYQVAWNALDPDERITPLSLQDIGQGEGPLKESAARFSHPMGRDGHVEKEWIHLPAGASQTVFSASSPGVIKTLSFKGRSKSDLEALECAAYWDGEDAPAFQCPLYMLAGVSAHLENMESFPVTVRKNRVEIRWPMPYRKARLELRNRAGKGIHLTCHVETAPSAEGLRFRGTFNKHPGLRTEARNLLTLADVTGAGRIVGCNIQVYSETKQWWGEGDQIIYLDTMQSPAWRGTGTEDYFGFAWCSTETFDHLFRGQSGVYVYGSARLSAMHRYHILDRLSFHDFAQFQTEAWGLAPGRMDYESLVLYYASPQ